MIKSLLLVLWVSFALVPASSLAGPKKAPTAKPTPEPEEPAPIPAPFLSEEDIEFTASTDQNMLGFAKPKEFVGLIDRPFASRKDLRLIEVYRFRNLRDLTIDKAGCESVASKIVGPLKTITLKHDKPEIFRLSFGSACELTLHDPDTEALAPERKLFIITVKKEVFGLYFHFSPKSQKGDSADIRTFLKGLK